MPRSSPRSAEGPSVSMIRIPEEPAELDGQRSSGPVALRYEDIVQDGRLALAALTQGFGQVVWPSLIRDEAAESVLRRGIIPILSRMVLEGGEGPLSFYEPLVADGVWHLARVVGPDGGTERILLNYWSTLRGPSGFTLAGRAPAGAPIITAGRAYAEHVFTRLFAPPGERRVTTLDIPGRPAVPPGTWPRRRFEDVRRPEAAVPLGEAARASVRFGLCHTDPNQHVNSLVYPRLFEDLAVHVLPTNGFARRVELSWRKPFFAGEDATILLQPWRLGEDLGASGAFVDGEGSERARVVMMFG